MSQIEGYLHLRFCDSEQCRTVEKLFALEDGGDSGSELSGRAQELEQIIDEMPRPDEMEILYGRELILYFEHSAFEVLQLLIRFLVALQPKLAMWLEVSGEQSSFYRFDGIGKLNHIFSVMPLDSAEDELRFNRVLPEELTDELRSEYADNISEAMSFLSNHQFVIDSTFLNQESSSAQE